MLEGIDWRNPVDTWRPELRAEAATDCLAPSPGQVRLAAWCQLELQLEEVEANAAEDEEGGAG